MAEVSLREATFDAHAAELGVRARSAVSPSMVRSLPREAAAAGLRMFHNDLAMRGSVGKQFQETFTQRERTVEQVEARTADGTHMRPDVAPVFSQGSGRQRTRHCAEGAARQRARRAVFKRSASAPGMASPAKSCGSTKQGNIAFTELAPRSGWAVAEA